MAGSASRTMLPPSPPSPPSGPPRGTNFSRRKLTQPAPPSPPLTKTSISSTNIGNSGEHQRPRGRRARSGGLLGDADVLVVALALEADVAVGGGEQRVVGPEAYIDAWLEAGAPLAHDDAARRHELPAEALDAKSLGIGIAPVAGTAHALLVCHAVMPRWC